MPELSDYPETNPDLLDELVNMERKARERMIDANWDYYEGRQRRPLKVRSGQIDDNIIVNLTRRVVDQSVSMLFGEMPTLNLPGETPETDAWESRLAELWRANAGGILLHDIALVGALAGHVFVRVQPELENAARPARFVLLNPRYCSVFWRPDDMQQVVCYRIAWERQPPQGLIRQALWGQRREGYRQDIVNEGANWRIREWQRLTATDAPWTLITDALWPWPWPPVLDWQNLPNPERYYGDTDLVASELDTGINLNDGVNFVASNINRILRYHAHPKSLGFGVQPQQIVATAVDGFWAGLPETARVENLEMQSDLASSMEFLSFLERAFYSQHRAVDMSTVKDRIGQLTNFGLRTMFKEALDKLTTKRTLYGNALAELSWRALQLLGWGQDQPTVSWPNPLPFNESEEMLVLAQELAAKMVSRQTAAEQRGRDWERELQRMKQEREEDQLGLGQVLARAMRDFDRGEGEIGNDTPDG